MKNIETILKEHGVELPDAERDAILKEVNANYKTIAEHQKLTDALANERQKVADATEALAKFEGLDPDATKKEVESLKKKLEEQEKKFNDTIAQRDYDDALAKGLDEYKFTSKAAKATIANKVKGANLMFKDGKILGLKDLIEQIKAEDEDAFAQESNSKQPAKVTEKGTGKSGTVGMTKDQIFAIKDAGERQAAIIANPQLFE